MTSQGFAYREVARGTGRRRQCAPERHPDEPEEEEEEDDPFEREMEEELERRANKAREDGGMHPAAAATSSSGAKSARYDDIYFDSDEEEEEGGGQSGQGQNLRSVVADEDLFYDPAEDDENQRFVDELRAGYRGKQTTTSRKKTGQPQQQRHRKAANSDAVLTCPGCFSLLCLDCQRHELYDNQFRAMFVVNCSVATGERLRVPLSKRAARKGGRKRKKGGGGGEQQEAPSVEEGDEETYHPVRCTECSTEVGVYDKDEVYHFFNVMVGH